uniref:hAT transposon family protein n=1 Tax=Acinetobacter baumannii TaxID=470 RepID=UPI003396C019
MQVPEGVKTLAMVWESDLPDNATLDAEYQRWVCKWRSAAENATAIIPSTASEALKHLKKKNERDFYPNLFIMLKNLCTLPVTTAECERSNSQL